MIQEKACSVKKKEVSEMLKRINDFLAGLPMTIIGGVLLVFSFALPRWTAVSSFAATKSICTSAAFP